MKKALVMSLLLAAPLIAACGGTTASSSSTSSSQSKASSTTSSSSKTSTASSSTSSTVTIDPKPTLEGFAIYAKVPETWTKPNVWGWKDGGDGINAFPSISWPGKAMIADTANAGWYYLTVPSYVNHVIINANQGSDTAIQSEAAEIESKNVWFSSFASTEVAAEGSEPAKTIYTITPGYTKETTGEVKAYEPMNYAYVYIPNDWKSAKMYGVKGQENAVELALTLQTDGWFTELVSYNYDYYYLTNGGTGTALKTSANIITKTDIGVNPFYVVVKDEKDATSGLYKIDLTYTKPTINVKTYLLHASVPASWTEPHIWAWNNASGTGAFTTWPGEKLEASGDFFDYNVPTFCDAIIINDGGVQNGVKGDSVLQTTDLKDVEAKECWVRIGEANTDGKFAASVSYTTPA